MISLFRSGSKLASTSAFAIAAFSLLSCGGSGTGEEEGWAPNSPVGYFFNFDTTTGTANSTARPGVIQLDFISDNQAILSGSGLITGSSGISIIAIYTKTGKNSFTISFSDIKSPDAAESITANFQAACVLASYNDNTKKTIGSADWTYSGWTVNNQVGLPSTEGFGSSIEVGFSITQ